MKIKLNQEQLEHYITVLNKYKQGQQLRCVCPKCGQGEFYISLIKDENPFRCWREKHCGYRGNIFTLLFDLGKLQDLDLKYKFEHYKDVIKHELENSIIEDEEFLPEESQLPLSYKRIYQSDYLDSRNFTKEDYSDIECGKVIIGKLKNYIIFPIRFFDTVVGFIGRSTLSKEKCLEQGILRYYKPSSVDFTKILFGIKKENLKTCIIVEGIFDKFAVDKYIKEFNILDTFCVATLLVGLNVNQIKILKLLGVENIIFFYDKDVIKNTIKESLNLFYIFNNVSLTFVESKDPGDANLDEIYNSLNNLKDPNSFSKEIIVNKIKNE